MSSRLSRERIVGAALTVLDREGVDGMSMRRLGVDLGVDAKAVYYYLPNKAALFDGVVEALVAEMGLADIPSDLSWDDELRVFASRLWTTLRTHPQAVLVFATRPVNLEVHGSGAEASLARLVAQGFSPRVALTMVSCVRSLVVGLVIAEVVAPAGAPSTTSSMPTPDRPTLAAAVAEGYDPLEQFTTGLEALLAGFEVPH